jgi:phytanoyl-CoA hydroxylase
MNASNDASSNSTTPTKQRQHAPLGFTGNLENVKVMQLINVHKADCLFRSLACNAQLGQVVAQLAQWSSGTRLCQDQVWAKPPGAPALTFHRDSPYFMFTPSDIVTVWIALDDMDETVGPLEYVRGSHLWSDARVGSSQFFFRGGNYLLQSAAEKEGIEYSDVEFVSMAGLKAGGMSIHNGRTWHGSNKNKSSTRPRRGLGIHFCPVHVRFTEETRKSRVWKVYLENETDASLVELPSDDFPITWRP